MLAKIGCGASGGGGGRLQAALAGGGTGAPGRPRGGSGRHVQQLVDAIIALGHLPTQCKNSSAAEKLLAVRLIRARKAGYLSSEQEGALGNLAQDQAEATAGSGVH